MESILKQQVQLECMQVEVHKQPRLGMNTPIVRLSTEYRHDQEMPLGAYQMLLLDVIEGDRSLKTVHTFR